MSDDREVQLINRQLEIAVLTNGQIIPITNWLDEDGDCDKAFAVTCVCGPCFSGKWYSVNLQYYENARVQ